MRNAFISIAIITITLTATIFSPPLLAEKISNHSIYCKNIDIKNEKYSAFSLSATEDQSNEFPLLATDKKYAFKADICLKIKNTSPEEQEVSILFDNPRAHHIEMSTTDKSDTFQMMVKGTSYPLNLWETLGAEIVFNQTIEPGEERQFNFRIGSIPPYNTQIIIEPSSLLFKKIISQRIATGILVGIIFSLVLTCAAIGISTNEKAYFLICGSTIFVTLLQLNDLGALFVLWPDASYWSSICSGIFAALSALFGANLARLYLETQKNTPIIDKILQIYSWYLVLVCIPTAMLENDRLYLMVFASVSVLIFMPAIVIASIIRIRQKFPPAKTYLAALVMPYISGLAIFLMYTGTLPSTPMVKILPLAGTALQLVLLAAAIGERINWLKSQQAIALEKESVAKSETRAKKSFLAHISHELRTPLIGIIGLAELAKKHSLYPTNKQLIDGINSSATSLLETTNTLLDHSRLDAGKWPISHKPFKPEDIAKSSVNKYSDLAKNSKLSLTLNYHHSAFDNIIGDEDVISRIIDEMIKNSVVLTKEGSIIINVQVKNHLNNNLMLLIDVVIGRTDFSEFLKSNLFELFEVADSSTTREQQGLGMGLSLSKKFCTLLGGNIGYDGDSQHGATLWCAIPCVAADTAASAASTPPPPSPTTRANKKTMPSRILLAEDDETLQLIMRAQLEKLEADYTLYPNGKPLIEAYMQSYQDIGMVILDWNMPICNASQTIAAIRNFEKNNAISPVTIVILSAHDQHSAKEMKIPADIQMLQKPISTETLKKILPATDHS